MQLVDYASVFLILYCIGVLASFVEKLSAYRFSIRYEEISRSRETKREVKEIRAKVMKEFIFSFIWPFELWNLFNRGR